MLSSFSRLQSKYFYCRTFFKPNRSHSYQSNVMKSVSPRGKGKVPSTTYMEWESKAISETRERERHKHETLRKARRKVFFWRMATKSFPKKLFPTLRRLLFDTIFKIETVRDMFEVSPYSFTEGPKICLNFRNFMAWREKKTRFEDSSLAKI